jgi:hypothetical protein
MTEPSVDPSKVPYKRPSIAGWLAPVLVAPFVAAYASVAAYAYLGPLPDLVPRTAFLVVGLAVASLWAPLFAVIQGLVDLALLAIRLRMLENGGRAWLRAFVAPLLPLASYAVYSPHNWWKLGPWTVVAAILVPMLLSAVAVRVVSGKRP